MSDADQAAAAAIVAIEGVWDEVRQSPWVMRDLGKPVDRLPDIGEGATLARGARAQAWLDSIADIDRGILPRDIAITLEVARASAERFVLGARCYWLAFDYLGVGFFSMFAPTVYGGGWLLASVGGMLARQRLADHGDLYRYRGLISDYARIVRQMLERTQGQVERGIRMPRVQAQQASKLLEGLMQSTGHLVPDLARLDPVGGATAAQMIDDDIKAFVDPAFADLLALVTDELQLAMSPDTVGISQYPGGERLYTELVKLHTTLDVSPEVVHQLGVERMTKVESAIASLLQDIGFKGTPGQYLESIESDGRWRATDADDITAAFKTYIDRFSPHVDRCFDFRPKAGYGVAPLPPAMSGSMTYGYYDAPGGDNPAGRYMFNTANLLNGSLAKIAALNYHELVPGHHFHLATQRENASLHPLRANAFFNAFNEGWAEYAATLAGEMDMYRTPEERFGRLMMDAFLTSRLVVDTGLNVIGWSLEEGRAYMRAHSFLSENEICSETIRYSCDMPGQALAYKLGEDYLCQQRASMRDRLGDRYDIRQFHNCVLRPGGLPLTLVGENVDLAVNEILAC